MESGASCSMHSTVKNQMFSDAWGCFSWNDVSHLYRWDFDRRGISPSANQLNPEGFIFEYDNDLNTSRIVRKYFQDKKIEQIEWPANH